MQQLLSIFVVAGLNVDLSWSHMVIGVVGICGHGNWEMPGRCEVVTAFSQIGNQAQSRTRAMSQVDPTDSDFQLASTTVHTTKMPGVTVRYVIFVSVASLTLPMCCWNVLEMVE
jgi:hypothetical protein